MPPPPPKHATCALPPRSRALGSIPGVPAAGPQHHTPILPATDWQQPTEQQRNLIVEAAGPAHDQGRFPSCYAHAFVGAFQLTRRLMALPDLDYSPEQFAARTGGRSSGYPIDDACAEIMRNGLLPAAEIRGDPWSPNAWPPGWRSTAQHHRILEATDCGTFEALASFLTLWTLPVALGYQSPAGGHAIYALYLKRKGSGWVVHCMNYWSARWGEQGRADFTRADLAAIQRYGAIGLRVVTRGPNDPQPRPPIAAWHR